MSRFLVIFCFVLLVLWLAWPRLLRWGFGRLPGDIVIERGAFRLYLPLATALLASFALSLLLRLFRH